MELCSIQALLNSDHCSISQEAQTRDKKMSIANISLQWQNCKALRSTCICLIRLRLHYLDISNICAVAKLRSCKKDAKYAWSRSDNIIWSFAAIQDFLNSNYCSIFSRSTNTWNRKTSITNTFVQWRNCKAVRSLHICLIKLRLHNHNLGDLQQFKLCWIVITVPISQEGQTHDKKTSIANIFVPAMKSRSL